MLNGSWRTWVTGILGLIAALGAFAKFAYDFFASGIVPNGAEVMLAFGALVKSWGMIYARDDKVTSEEAGAK